MKAQGHCRDCGHAYHVHGCGCQFCPDCWRSCPRCGGLRASKPLEREQRLAVRAAQELSGLVARLNGGAL